jgi:hypothetical protein
MPRRPAGRGRVAGEGHGVARPHRSTTGGLPTPAGERLCHRAIAVPCREAPPRSRSPGRRWRFPCRGAPARSPGRAWLGPARCLRVVPAPTNASPESRDGHEAQTTTCASPGPWRGRSGAPLGPAWQTPAGTRRARSVNLSNMLSAAFLTLVSWLRLTETRYISLRESASLNVRGIACGRRDYPRSSATPVRSSKSQLSTTLGPDPAT